MPPPRFRRVRGPDARVYAPFEAGSLPPNSSAEAALLLSSLFAETCYEELVQVKRLLSENRLRLVGAGTERDADLLQTSLLILYKNKVHGDCPELGRGGGWGVVGARGCTL